MPAASRRTLSRTVAPAALLLLAALLAERAGAHGLTFYLLVAGIPVAVVGGLAALDRVVDPDEVAPRLEAALSAVLLFLFVIGAAARSPGTLEDAAPGSWSSASCASRRSPPHRRRRQRRAAGSDDTAYASTSSSLPLTRMPPSGSATVPSGSAR